MREMARQWMTVEDALRAEMMDLSFYLEELRQKGEVITPARLMQMERYKRLIADSRAQQTQYSQWAATQIATNQSSALVDGVAMAQDTILAAMADAKVSLGFDRINAGSVDFLIGFAADGSPLNSLLRASYPESVMRLTDELVKGLATGAGPRTTAKLMADAMGGNFDRALTIARTEQLRALRTSNLAQMDKSNVVSGYIRRAQRSGNVCPACIALDGTFQDTAEIFAAHPNDQCYAQPVLKFGKTPQFPSGPEWFDTLPPTQQQKMLGPGRFKLYQDGALDWGKVATVHEDPTWGPTIRQTTLGELRQ